MPLFIADVIAYESSKLICKTPNYKALAGIFLADLRQAEAAKKPS